MSVAAAPAQPLTITLAHQADVPGWRDAARRLVGQSMPPDQVVWRVAGDDAELFGLAEATATLDPPPPAASDLRVPKAFLDVAERVALAREPARFALLYAMLWRIAQGERHLMELSADPMVLRAQALDASVRRDIHKMRAFLRFREVPPETEGAPMRYAAWFEPTHYIVERNAGFFVRRFPEMRWTILTPDRTVDWDLQELRLGPGASKEDVPPDDALEGVWRTYFKSIFNPARLKLKSMQGHMPRKYWKNMPETDEIPGLIRAAQARTQAMVETAPTEPTRTAHAVAAQAKAAPSPLAAEAGLPALREAVHACRNCDLWRPATQAVFGEGPADAPIMLVGEQPGDQEDLAGRPFVGPAGQILDRALAEAGVDRAQIYVTNAVKHFKFEPRGKRRLHQTPGPVEITACRPWLKGELETVKPKLVVLLGATAAKAALQRPVGIMRERGQVIPFEDGAAALITVHPSFLLRLPDEAAKQKEYAAFVRDLTLALPFAA